MNPVIEERMAHSIVHEDVQHNVEWLDENFPGWHTEIDMRDFDLGSASMCICGQVFYKQADRCGMPSGFDYAMETYDNDMDLTAGFCPGGQIVHFGNVMYGHITQIELDWIYIIHDRMVQNEC